MKILEQIITEGGLLYPRRALVGCAQPSPPPVPIFWYIRSFDLEKKGEDFRDGVLPSGGRTWAGALLLSGGAIPSRETSLPEGEIIVIIITNNPLIFGRAISINIFNSTISSQTLVHLSCSIFVPEPHIGTCEWLVVLITSCSWSLYGLFGGRLYVKIQYAI